MEQIVQNASIVIFINFREKQIIGKITSDGGYFKTLK